MHNDLLLRQVQRTLDVLRSFCNARLVFLANQDGQIISISGKVDEIDIQRISSAYSKALFSLLSENEKIDSEKNCDQLIYRESKKTHIFVSNIGCELALFVVSHHEQMNQRLGMISNFVKKISPDLQKNIVKPNPSLSKELIPSDFIKEVDRELDNLFTSDKDSLT